MHYLYKLSFNFALWYRHNTLFTTTGFQYPSLRILCQSVCFAVKILLLVKLQFWYWLFGRKLKLILTSFTFYFFAGEILLISEEEQLYIDETFIRSAAKRMLSTILHVFFSFTLTKLHANCYEQIVYGIKSGEEGVERGKGKGSISQITYILKKFWVSYCLFPPVITMYKFRRNARILCLFFYT